MKLISEAVQDSIWEAMTANLRDTISELASVRQELADVKQELENEKAQRKLAESTLQAQPDLSPMTEQMQSLFSTALQRIDNVVTRVADVGRSVEANTQAIKQIPAGPTEIAFDIKRDAAGKPLAVIARSNP